MNDSASWLLEWAKRYKNRGFTVFLFPDRHGQRIVFVRTAATVAECAAELRVQQMWMHLN